MYKIYLGLFITILSLVISFSTHTAVAGNDKVNVCHKTGSENNPWITQQVNANELQSHLDNGDFLYNGPVNPQNGQPTNDGDQWCEDNIPQASPSPSPSPAVSPSPSPLPSTSPDPSPTPSPSVSPSPTPSPSASATPTPNPSSSSSNNQSSNNTSGGNPSSSQGEVLGASTLASTGTLMNDFVNLGGFAGILLILSGVYNHAQKIKR